MRSQEEDDSMNIQSMLIDQLKGAQGRKSRTLTRAETMKPQVLNLANMRAFELQKSRKGTLPGRSSSIQALHSSGLMMRDKVRDKTLSR